MGAFLLLFPTAEQLHHIE